MTDDTFYDSVGLHQLETSQFKTVYRHSGRDWQDAETIFFMHGNLMSGRWWEPTMAAFDELLPGNYACYAPDLPGYGEASSLTGAVSTVEAMLGVMDAIGIKRAHMVGWSQAGEIVRQMALSQPQRCLSLVLISSATPGDTAQTQDLPEPQRQLLTEAIGRGDLDLAARVLRASYFREGHFPTNSSPVGNALFYYLLQSAMQITTYPKLQLPASSTIVPLQLPVLNIHGNADALISNELYEQARHYWQSDRFKEVIFENTGHAPPVEQPRRVAIMLDEFFADL